MTAPAEVDLSLPVPGQRELFEIGQGDLFSGEDEDSMNATQKRTIAAIRASVPTKTKPRHNGAYCVCPSDDCTDDCAYCGSLPEHVDCPAMPA